jgi:2-methylcitrate dehydratase PrpD
MHRRKFIKTAVGAGAAFSSWNGTLSAASLTKTTGGDEEVYSIRDDITPYVAKFIAETRYSDLPADVIELGKKSLLDAFGLALVGGKSKGGRILQRYFDSLGCTNGAVRVLGTSDKRPLRFAAFANGVSIHMEDFDDTQLAVAADRVYGQLTHPTAPVFPAALGMADLQRVTGEEFMLAYHVGIEVACKIAEACAPRAYKNGFHSTGIFGVFGSLAACAKIRHYDVKLIEEAIAIAASQSAGLSQNFGTLTKPFHAGHAAEAGVVAADLAALGWDGAPNILESQNGFSMPTVGVTTRHLF